jgi:hypothetical protein
MSEGRRGGERRQHARQSVCTRRRHERSLHALRGRVLRSVLRPVHVDPHYAPGRKPRRWGVRFGITVGQARATEKNQHWGRDERTERGSPRVTASARKIAWLVEEKEGDRGLRPCEDWKEPGFSCPHVVNAVAEVGRRRLVSNKLGKRAPKRAAGSSERGPSSERRSAGETVGRRVGRRDESRVGLTAKTGEDRRKTQDDERSSSSGFHIAKSGAEVAGPGL